MKLSSFEYNSFFDNVSGRFDKYNRQLVMSKQNIDSTSKSMIDVQGEYVLSFSDDIPSISHVFDSTIIQFIRTQYRNIINDNYLTSLYYRKVEYNQGFMIEVQQDIRGIGNVQYFIANHVDQFTFPVVEADKNYIYSQGKIKQQNGLTQFAVEQTGQNDGDRFILNKFEYVENNGVGYIQPVFILPQSVSSFSFLDNSEKLVEIDYSNVENNYVKILFNYKTGSPLFRENIYSPEVRNIDEFGLAGDSQQRSYRFQLPERKPAGYFQIRFTRTSGQVQETTFMTYDELKGIIVEDTSSEINYFTIGQQTFTDKVLPVYSLDYMNYIQSFYDEQEASQENYSLQDIYDLLMRKAIRSISADSYNIVQNININGQTNYTSAIQNGSIQQVLPQVNNNNYLVILASIDSEGNKYIGYKTKEGGTQWYGAVYSGEHIDREQTIQNKRQIEQQITNQYIRSFDTMIMGYYGAEDDLEAYFDTYQTPDPILQERVSNILENNLEYILISPNGVPGDPDYYIRKTVSVEYSIIPSFFNINYINEVDVNNLQEQIYQILLSKSGKVPDTNYISRDNLFRQIVKSQSSGGKMVKVSGSYDNDIQDVLVRVMGQQVYVDSKDLSELLVSNRYVPQNVENKNGISNIKQIEQPQWLTTNGRSLTSQYENTIKDFVFVKFQLDVNQNVSYQTYDLIGDYDKPIQIKNVEKPVKIDDSGILVRIGNRQTSGSFNIRANCYSFTDTFSINFIPYYKKYSFDINMRQHDFVQFKGRGMLDTDKMKYTKLSNKVIIESQKEENVVVNGLTITRIQPEIKEIDNALDLAQAAMMSSVETGLSAYYAEGDVSDVYPLNQRDNYEITTYQPIDQQYRQILTDVGNNIRNSIIEQLKKERELTSYGVDDKPRVDMYTFTSMKQQQQTKTNEEIQMSIDNAQARNVVNTEKGPEYGRKRKAVDQSNELDKQQAGKVRQHLSKTYGKVGIGYDTYVYTVQESGLWSRIFTIILSIAAVVASFLTFGVGTIGIQVAIAQIGGIYGIQQKIVDSFKGTQINVNIGNFPNIGQQMSIKNIESIIKNLDAGEANKDIIVPLSNIDNLNLQQVLYDLQNTLRMIAKSPDDSKQIKGIEEIRFIMNNNTDVLQAVIPYGIVSTTVAGDPKQTIQRKNTQIDMSNNNRILIQHPDKINNNTYSFKLSDISKVDAGYRNHIIGNIENINTFSLAGFLVYYSNNEFKGIEETTYYKYVKNWENTETKWFLKKYIHRKQWTDELREYSIETPVFGIRDIRFLGRIYQKTDQPVELIFKNILPSPSTFSDIVIELYDDSGNPLDDSVLTGVVGQPTDIGMKVIINGDTYSMVQSTAGQQKFQLSGNNMIQYDSEGNVLQYNKKDSQVVDEIRPIIQYHNQSFYGSAKIGFLKISLY